MALHSFGKKALMLLCIVYWTCILASNEESVETLVNVDKIITANNEKPISVANLLKLLAKITNADYEDDNPLYPPLKKKVRNKFLGLNYLPKRSNNPASGNNGMMCHFKLCNLGRRR